MRDVELFLKGKVHTGTANKRARMAETSCCANLELVHDSRLIRAEEV